MIEDYIQHRPNCGQFSSRFRSSECTCGLAGAMRLQREEIADLGAHCERLEAMLEWSCGFLEHLGKFPVEGYPELNIWWERRKRDGVAN